MNSSLKKAVILAAGKGTRMKELTAHLPKPMVPVAGMPVLEHIIRGLTAVGIKEFLIITGYKAEAVRSQCGDGSDGKASIHYSQQQVQDGTGRVIELSKDFVANNAFLLSYGDILVSNTTYAAIQENWSKEKLDGILTVKLGEDVRKGAIAIFDDQFNLRELVEKPLEPEIERLRHQFRNFKPWYNAGIYAFRPSIFHYTSKLQKSVRGEYELTDAIRQMASDKLKMRGVVITDYWIDVRDSEALAEADRRLASSE